MFRTGLCPVVDKNLIMERLKNVLDPEIGRSIVDLNMVRDVMVDDGNVTVKIALTVAHCPLAKTLQTDVENAVRKPGDVKSVRVDTTTMTRKELEELRLRLQTAATPSSPPKNAPMVGPGIERLGKRGIRSIIAIISGKGGVGKSFVTSALASDLRKRGYEVGVLDADPPLTVFQSLPLDGVIVVSSPQDLASMIVSKAVNMAKKMDAPILGLVENMSYLNCPSCGERVNLFGEPKGEKLASSLGLAFLGAVPVDPSIARLSDEGRIEDYSSPIITSIADELRIRSAKQVEQLTQGLPIAWSIEPTH